jgi:hypothetical protein
MQFKEDWYPAISRHEDEPDFVNAKACKLSQLFWARKLIKPSARLNNVTDLFSMITTLI